MSLFNQLIPSYVLNDKRQIRVAPQMQEPVYIDDAFDPLFNKRAQAYLNAKYGRFLRIPAGYAEMLDNMLVNSTKQWGPLGPGMGILGTFGRTIDKAEDFLLGGITEATKLGTNLNPLGHYEPVKNPLREVFVEDNDYTGQKLMAAMANNMSRIAGGTALTENDFNGAWNIPALGIEIATDPGILGGAISRSYAPMVELTDDALASKMVPLQKAAQSGKVSSKEIMDMLSKETNIKSAVGEAGQLMSNFDDVLAKMSWDITAPGLRFSIGKLKNRLDDVLRSNRYSTYVNVDTKELEEVKQLEELMKNYKKAKKLPDVKKRILSKTGEFGTSEYLQNAINDIYKKIEKTPIENLSMDELSDVRTNLSKLIYGMENFNEDIYKAQIISEYLQEHPDNLEMSGILNEFKDTGKLNISKEFDEALKPHVLELMRSDTKTLKELKSFEQTLNNYNNFRNNNELYMQIGEVIKNKNLIESKLKKSVEDFYTNSFFSHHLKPYKSSNATLAIEKYVKDNPSLFMEYTPEKLTKEIYNDAYNKTLLSEMYMGDPKDKALNPKFDQAIFDEQVYSPEDFVKEGKPKTTSSEIGSKLIKNIDESLKTYRQAPVRFSVNRFRMIQEVSQKTPILQLYRNKFASIAKNVADGNQETFNKLMEYFEKGNFDGILEGMQDSPKYSPLFKLYGHAKDINSFTTPKVIKELANKYDQQTILEAINEGTGPAVEDFEELYKKYSRPYINKISRPNFEEFHRSLREFTDVFKDTLSYDALANYNYLITEEGKASLKTISNTVNEYNKLYKDFDELRQLTDMIKVGTDTADDTVYSVVNTWNQYFQKYIDEGKDIFTKANGEFNFDLYHQFKEKFPLLNVDFNDAVTRVKYGKTADEMKELYNIMYPSLNQAPTFDKVYNKAGDKLDFNNVENFYKVIDSNDPYNMISKKYVNKYKPSFGKKYNTFVENNVIAINDSIMNSPVSNFEYLVQNTENPNLIKATEELSKFTGIPVDDIRNNFNKVEDLLQQGKDQSKFYTRLHYIVNDDYILNANKNTLASVRAAKEDIFALEKVKGEFFKKYQAHHPMAKTKEIQEKWNKACSMFLNDKSKAMGDVVKKEDFLKTFVDAEGIFIARVPKKESKALIEALSHNARIINKNAQLVIPFTLDKGDMVITGLKLNTKEKDLLKLFKKSVKLDDTKDLLSITFANPQNVNLARYEEINDLVANVNKKASDFYNEIGIDASVDYIKQKLVPTTENINKIHNFYKEIGIDNIDEIRNAGSEIQKMYNKHGAFMTFDKAKSFRGGFHSWYDYDFFEQDLTKLAKSTFTDGIFENRKVQSYISLCMNDNTKMSSWAKDWQDMKRIIHAKDFYGKESGNLKNFILASPVLDEQGHFIKFKEYDMLTDKGIQEAWENNAFYIPRNMFASLDKMVKKDVKMNNKLYTFLNKYLILPFKFGALANPGFIVGNVNDAYMKQALTLSQKYGTSVAEEFANVSESIYDIMKLNENFDEIYRNKFLPYLGEKAVKDNALYKISANGLYDEEISKKFLEWYNANKNTLTKIERDNIDLQLYINKYIPTMTGDLTAFDLEDVSKYTKGKKFEQPKSFVEKRLMGNHYDPHNITTWGLYAGNPGSNFVMRISGDVETLFRSASVLNDLKHTYKNKDNLIKIIGLDPKEYAKRHSELTAKTLDAINLMNAANFNYDDMSNFMQKVSYLMPFPTFYLKNLGYWTEVLLEHPEYIDTILTTQNAMWHGIDTSKDNFQAEAKGRGSLPMSSIIGQKPSKIFKGVLKPTMTNSMFSAFSTINSPLKDIANRTNPALSTITHHLQDKENVRYRPYSTDPYEKNIKLGDKNFSKLTYTFHRLNPYDRFLNTYLRTPAKIKTKQAQMSDFLPSLFQPDYSRKETNKK